MEFVTSFPHYLSNKLSYVETMQVQNRSGTVTVTISSPCTSVALLYIQPLDLSLYTRLCFRPTDIHTKLKRGKKYELEGFTGTMLVTIYAGNLYKQVQLRVHVLSTLKDVQLRLKLPSQHTQNSQHQIQLTQWVPHHLPLLFLMTSELSAFFHTE